MTVRIVIVALDVQRPHTVVAVMATNVRMREQSNQVSLADRAGEKQAVREDDFRALASGTKTVEQLRRENSFALPPPNATIDYRAVPRARLR